MHVGCCPASLDAGRKGHVLVVFSRKLRPNVRHDDSKEEEIGKKRDYTKNVVRATLGVSENLLMTSAITFIISRIGVETYGRIV